MQSNGSLSTATGANASPGRVLYVGQCYYNTWYLSRALRDLGWKADVLNIDPTEGDQIFYHGQDFKFRYGTAKNALGHLMFYLRALRSYDIFHFTGTWNLRFVSDFDQSWILPERWDIKLLKKLGKKIAYTNVGCLDGVSQSSFRTWLPEPVCDICPWQHRADVCSDERNLAWGKFRNSVADFQVMFAGNRKDYNLTPLAHEVPEWFCLDPQVWSPDLLIPSNYRLPIPEDTVKIYHAIGNFESRTDAATQRNIKSTHVYLPLIDQLKAEGHKVEMIFFQDVPNKKVRFYQAQADIVVDMLTFGWFGANIREALMLGKPSVCFLRPEWLETIRREIPEYIDELPVISATPENVHDILVDLIEHPEKRREIGRRSREFAVKWHSAEAGARRMDEIYSNLLSQTN